MKTTKDRRSNCFRNTIAILLALSPSVASAATVRGNTDAAVVWISVPPTAVAATTTDMRNRDRTFVPSLTIVPVGGFVRFPNDDPFYHSIYSDSSTDPFDIGYYGQGPGKSVAFNTPGIVEVHCHIHAYMHATIVVVDGPYAQPRDGHYALTGVPAGKHIVHAWDAGHGERTASIDVPNGTATVTADLH